MKKSKKFIVALALSIAVTTVFPSGMNVDAATRNPKKTAATTVKKKTSASVTISTKKTSQNKDKERKALETELASFEAAYEEYKKENGVTYNELYEHYIQLYKEKLAEL